MDIVFLGTSAATAMPLPFCNCTTCVNARKNKGRDIRKRASIVINEDLLIDLGPDSINACYQYDIDITKVKYLLQTHAHSDHFDAGHFITRHIDYATKNVNELLLLASQKTMNSIATMLTREDKSSDLFSKDFQEKTNLLLKIVEAYNTYKIDNYLITPMISLHDVLQESLIYLINQDNKTVLYATDLLLFSEENYNYLLANKIYIDVLILDQTYGANCNSGGHLNANQVIDIIHRLNKNKTIDEKTKIYATHISHEGNLAHDIAQKVAEKYGYSIAYDGLKITI